jgi:hypothetical protein
MRNFVYTPRCEDRVTGLSLFEVPARKQLNSSESKAPSDVGLIPGAVFADAQARLTAKGLCSMGKKLQYLAAPKRSRCQVGGCTSSVLAREFCSLHYYRWSRNGAPILSPPRTLGSWQKITRAERAYLAGFIDGEGTIGMKRERRRLAQGHYSYQAYVSAGNTNPVVIEWLYTLFGGNLRKRTPKSILKKSPNAKPDFYEWRIGAKAAVAVCELLVPFLRMKREQARIVLADCGDTRKRGSGRYPAEHWDKLERTYQQLKQLNRRGREVANGEPNKAAASAV